MTAARTLVLLLLLTTVLAIPGAEAHRLSSSGPVAFCIGVDDATEDPHLVVDIGKSCSAAPGGT